MKRLEKLDCRYSPKDPHCERVFIPQHREPPACNTILNQNNFLFVIRALIPACFDSYLHLTTNISLFFKQSKSHNYTLARSPLSNVKPKRATKVRAQPGQQGALCQRQEVQVFMWQASKATSKHHYAAKNKTTQSCFSSSHSPNTNWSPSSLELMK